MSDGGKGSKPRPFSISQQEYDNRWDNIFSRDLKEEKVDMPRFQDSEMDKSTRNNLETQEVQK